MQGSAVRLDAILGDKKQAPDCHQIRPASVVLGRKATVTAADARVPDRADGEPTSRSHVDGGTQV